MKIKNKTMIRIILISVITILLFIFLTRMIYTHTQHDYQSNISNYYIDDYIVKEGDTLWNISEEIIKEENLKITIREYNSLLYEVNEGSDVFSEKGFIRKGKILKILRLN